jgi:hypothetical protein
VAAVSGNDRVNLLPSPGVLSTSTRTSGASLVELLEDPSLPAGSWNGLRVKKSACIVREAVHARDGDKG